MISLVGKIVACNGKTDTVYVCNNPMTYDIKVKLRTGY